MSDGYGRKKAQQIPVCMTYARNPRIGDPFYVPESECLKFTPAKSIKEHFRQKHEPATKDFPD